MRVLGIAVHQQAVNRSRDYLTRIFASLATALLLLHHLPPRREDHLVSTLLSEADVALLYSWDQALLGGVAETASTFSLASLVLRLYRDIKSCPSALDVDAVVEVACEAGLVVGIATWGWNDGGGYKI
jgi:hypothetical protein